MSRLRLFLLGPTRVERDGVPVSFDRHKAVALLVYLAVTRQRHRRDALAALFWPELAPSRARAALRRTLAAIRQGIGGGWLDADRETAGLSDGCPLWTDVARFHELLAAHRAHDHPQDRLCSSCLDVLSEAVALYGGDFMAGFTLRDSPDFDDWQREQGEGLRFELSTILEKLVRGHAAQGDLEAAIGYARRWLSPNPLREEVHRHLMRLYARCGQRAAAIAQYQACRDVLEMELGISPAQETVQLYHDVRENRPLSFLPVQATPPSNLPRPVTSFVGRKSELDEIARRLADSKCRLLTLVGPGGIGKTRLALEAAARQTSCFSHGVYFVPLTAVRSGDLAVPAIADAIGFSFGAPEREETSPFGSSGQTPQAQLLSHLWNKEMLLVLDNLEHLIDSAALLAEMLSAAPRLKLLVTSRQRLDLSGEWLLQVRGMQVPGEDGIESTGMAAPSAGIEKSDAIQLFLSTARRIAPGYSGRAGDLIRICRLLDGMPLAIELAAAWAHTLSCREIAHEVERAMASSGLDFFATHLHDVPQRHQSMRAVFEHSWSLLSERERATLAAMSVFRGGFDRDAVAQVVGAPLSTLSALVDKSLVRRTALGEDDGHTRYDLHELLRQYAEEKQGEGTQWHDRHCRYYAAFLGRQEARLRGSQQGRALVEIEREIDNLRAAWVWAISQRRHQEIGQALESLHRFYEIRSRFREGRTALEQAVAALETNGIPDPLLFGRLLARLGRLAFHLDELGAAQSNLERSLAILRPLDVPHEVVRTLMWLSEIASRQGKRAQAESLLREGLTMSQQRGDRHLTAEVLNCLADWTASGQAIQEAGILYRRSLAIFRELGDRLGIANALYGLALVAGRLKQREEAGQLLGESLAIRREMGDRRGMAWCLYFLAENARAQSEYAESRRLYERSLAIHRELGDPLRTWNVLQRMGTVVHWLGDDEALEEINREIYVLALRLGDRFGIACALEGLGEVAHLKGEYAKARRYYQESLDIGHEIEHPRAIAWSLMGLGDADYETGQYAAAQARYERSLGICQEHEVEDGILLSLVRLGNTACAMGDYAASRAYLARALRFEMNRGYVGAVVNVLSDIASLLAEDGEVEDALALAAFLVQRPEIWRPDRDKVQKLLDELAAGIPPHVATAAQQRGRTRTLDGTCDVVLRILLSADYAEFTDGSSCRHN